MKNAILTSDSNTRACYDNTLNRFSLNTCFENGLSSLYGRLYNLIFIFWTCCWERTCDVYNILNVFNSPANNKKKLWSIKIRTESISINIIIRKKYTFLSSSQLTTTIHWPLLLYSPCFSCHSVLR